MKRECKLHIPRNKALLVCKKNFITKFLALFHEALSNKKSSQYHIEKRLGWKATVDRMEGLIKKRYYSQGETFPLIYVYILPYLLVSYTRGLVF